MAFIAPKQDDFEVFLGPTLDNGGCTKYAKG